MNKIILSLATSALIATSGVAFAQAADPVASPRAEQVQTRIDNQETKINSAEAAGKITPAQANKDLAKDAKVQAKLNKDEAKNNGKLTKAEQKHLNKKLNKNTARMHHQKKEAVHG